MVKEELVEGLRVALKKGEPLRVAMMSFYNAGYLKEDIEEAAAIVSVHKKSKFAIFIRIIFFPIFLIINLFKRK